MTRTKVVRGRKYFKRKRFQKNNQNKLNKLFHETDILPELLNFNSGSFKLTTTDYIELLQQFIAKFGVKCISEIIFCGIYHPELFIELFAFLELRKIQS